MPRLLVLLPVVALIGAGCGVGEPGMLAGAAGSAATGRGGRGGSGGRGGGAAVGVVGTTGVGGFTGAACGTDFVVERLPAEVLILLDASSSMNDDARGVTCDQGCGATSKWAATVAAINTTVARTDTIVNWGLKVFPEALSCGVANGVGVPVGPGNAGAIAMALRGRTSTNGGTVNGGGTPTRTAEIAAVNYLNTQTTPSPRFILLATDGLPNCTPGQPDTTIDDTAGAVKAVEDARTAGYPTFVVGIGIVDRAADATLTQMAGAGAYPRAGSPSYYPVASAAELDAALGEVLTIVGPCRFPTPTPTNDGTTSRAQIGVRVNGTHIPRDSTHTEGWDFTDASMTSIEVFGSVCDSVKAGETRNVSIFFNCLAG